MDECIFCRIVRGEIPCYKVFEDDNVLAFLDVNPISRGHTLVIPKEHYADVFDIPEELLKEIIVVAKKISSTHMKKLRADGINISQSNKPAANQVVMHYHLHVIPRYKNDGIVLMHGTQAQKKDFEQVMKQLE
jgi:histidine triad (HIT) family protein